MDDYGYFKGVKEAVDEYFQKLNEVPFLHRIDSSGRLMIKDWTGRGSSHELT